MKTDIFNLIILDESGSMGHIQKQTISGCNETINTIRSAQKNFAETQNHFVSIYAFQSDGNKPSRYIIKNMPVAEVNHINSEQYTPWGGTPLLDAVGATLVDLKTVAKSREFALGSVTIITDGMENSSHYYTQPKVAKMISELKELGWSFNFIGANIDVKATAASLNIDNALEFTQDDEGTAEMFAQERNSRMAWASRTNCIMAEEMASPCSGAGSDKKTLFEKLKKSASGYFKK